MVEQVAAYKANTGRVHDTREAAYADEAHTAFRLLWKTINAEDVADSVRFADWAMRNIPALYTASVAGSHALTPYREDAPSTPGQ